MSSPKDEAALAGRTKEILKEWAKAGICMTCFADLDGEVTGEPEDHWPWCTE